jgi:hypothetical protein
MARAFQELAPMPGGSAIPPFTRQLLSQATAQLHELSQHLMLSVRHLEPFGHGQGILCRGDERHQAGEADSSSPTQTESPVAVCLQIRGQEQQASPLLQILQGDAPVIALHQQFQFAPEARPQCRRSLCWWITTAPGPGPGLQRPQSLGKALRSQLKAQPGRIAGGPHQPCGIVSKAGGMQKAQLPRRKISLPSMGVQQSARGQIEGHGIDRQISPGKIIY